MPRTLDHRHLGPIRLHIDAVWPDMQARRKVEDLGLVGLLEGADHEHAMVSAANGRNRHYPLNAWGQQRCLYN
jgi:hypothetical protein